MSRLVIEGISKSFPGVNALTDISFAVAAGEVHAVCGENGAGKSTLMNILAGNLTPDSGAIHLDGVQVFLKNSQQAFEHRVAIVYQHLSLVDNLSIAENIFANEHPVNTWGIIQHHVLHREAELLLGEMNITLKPETLVSHLGAAEKQLVEIAKALAKKPRLLILDEPTASLTDIETQTLFAIIRRLKAEGVSIIYISHRLTEIESIADRISVLKDGVHQGTFKQRELTRTELIRKMVGRDLLHLPTEKRGKGDVILEVRNLRGNEFRQISFQLRKGEILGFAGLVGAGRTEIAKAVFGLHKKKGDILIHDKAVNINHPRDARHHGMAYVPEDRKKLGLFPEMSVAENIAIAKLEESGGSPFFNAEKIKSQAEIYRNKLHIRTPHVKQKVIFLSGGNQQKVVFARWLLTGSEILIIDEPTHGIDVGAKHEIYKILQDLAMQGKAIIIISSELPELMALCDRILVIKGGTIAGELSGTEASEEKIMALAT